MKLSVPHGVRISRTPSIETAKMMDRFISLAGETGPGRCSTCAFRRGSEASQSIWVPLQIETCILTADPFMCHHGLPDDSTKPVRQCAGYRQLATKLGGAT